MATSKIQILIEADDKASAKIRALAAGLDEAGKKGKASGLSIKDAMKGVTAALAGAGVVAGTFKKAMDFAVEGAQLQRLEAAGDKMAESFGQNMDDLVDAIQRATNGAIPQFEAMGLANRALLLGVAQTPDQFTKLATAAAALGQAMGRTSSEAMTDIVTGIGRMSPLILDNLGIMTKGGKIFDEYAAANGRAAASLTDTERKQILLNAALEAAQPLLSNQGTLVADNATSWEALAAGIKDATDGAKIWLADGLTPILSGAQALGRAHEEQIDRLVEESMSWEDFKGLMREQSLAMQLLSTGFSETSWQLAKLGETQGAVAGSWEDRMRGMKNAVTETMPEIKEEISAATADMPSIWDNVFPSPSSLAQQLQEQIDFIQAGGPGLVAAVQNVMAGLEEGVITPEQAEEMLDPISAAAAGLDVQLGNTTMWEAAEQRAKDVGIPFDEARRDIEAGTKAINNLPSEIDIKINWIMENPIPGRQHGGSVWPGQPFLVGEAGPELFVPSQPGMIQNTHTDNRTFNFNANGLQGGEDLLEKFQQRARRS